MAFGMKHWLLAAVTACGLVAVAKLPPQPFEAKSPKVAGLPASQEEALFRALRDDVWRAHQRLQRLRWSDSVPARLLAEALDGWAAGVYAPVGSYPVALPDELRATFAAELARIPARRSDVVVGAYAVDASLGAIPEASGWGNSMGWARETYLGAQDGVTYCLNVEGVPLEQAQSAKWYSWRFFDESAETGTHFNHLGVCRWVAEFGAPGPGVHRWLRSGALALVHEPSTERWRPSYWAPGFMTRRRFLFGISSLWGNTPGVSLDACLAGLEEPCARMFVLSLGAQPPRSDEVDAGAFLGRFGRVYSSQAYEWRWLLADLYAEFGPERTHAFWTSPSADVLTAFRDAFGVEAGAWISTWVRGSNAYVPPGPMPRSNALAWSLVVLLATAGIGGFMGLRRTVA